MSRYGALSRTTDTLRIEGLTGELAVAAVKHALENLDGVELAEVSDGEARVTYDRTEVDRTALEAAVREQGYVPLPAEG